MAIPFQIWIHLIAALAALALGIAVFAMPKGTSVHKAMGRTWVALMLTVAVSSFWITGLADGFSVIHILSVVTIVSLGAAVWHIRRGNRRAHMGFMIGSFMGLIGAGAGTLAPGRIVASWLYGG